MCGRFSSRWPREAWNAVLGPGQWLDEGHSVSCGDVFPGQWTWVVVRPGEVQAMRWGWRVDWTSRLLINARRETVAARPTFRAALHQRGAVLADAFYEWQASPRGEKQPWRIALCEGEPLLLAALWRQEADGTRAVIVLTEPAAPELAWLHDRQPVAVPGAELAQWLTGPWPTALKSLAPTSAPGTRWQWETVPGPGRRAGKDGS
ncbi:MAG: SOS response-associated peptidase [Firmicutes bacterium]|nr:SOS response-associated peptidase family protein [Alicyclobacillaceae bacterium]MCL6496572.1 SOS response-associated peptidase [Bacillota bacterium]